MYKINATVTFVQLVKIRGSLSAFQASCWRLEMHLICIWYLELGCRVFPFAPGRNWPTVLVFDCFTLQTMTWVLPPQSSDSNFKVTSVIWMSNLHTLCCRAPTLVQCRIAPAAVPLTKTCCWKRNSVFFCCCFFLSMCNLLPANQVRQPLNTVYSSICLLIAGHIVIWTHKSSIAYGGVSFYLAPTSFTRVAE